MSVDFQPLASDEGPESGLFFIQALYAPVPMVEGPATGLAFLVGHDGLLATCSHVPLVAGRIPGSLLTLYSAAPDMPFMVDAKVLHEGWRGPDWRPFLGNEFPERNLLADVDHKPDSYMEDIAFLRLLPETARWDPARTPPPGDAVEWLATMARVLPLGAPGYPHGSGTLLKSWLVGWEDGAPNLEVGDAHFLGSEPRLRHVIRFRTSNIGPGFSGAPLWDPVRGRVVGMVRRGVEFTPDMVLGADARRIAELGGVQIRPDRQAEQALSILRRIAEAFAPLRHFSLLGSGSRQAWVELRVRTAASSDLLGDDDGEEVAAVPAIPKVLELIARHPVSVLSGGAGSGKSTMLWYIAEALLREDIRIGGRRLVPLMIRASDFQRVGFDIAAVLGEAATAYSWDADGATLAEALARNDLTPLILLDGLDEIDRTYRAKVIARLGAAGESTRNARIIVATRPIDDLKLSSPGRSVLGWPVLELQHLRDADIEAFAGMRFPDAATRQAFIDHLAAVAWDRRGPTPLQIAAAAMLFEAGGGVPERPIDLTFALIDHLLEQGREVTEARIRGGAIQRSRADAVYVAQLRPILRWAGELTIGGGATRQEAIAALDGKAADWAQDPPELFRFIRREVELFGGLLSLEGAEGPSERLTWPHRSFAEALAAEQIASHHSRRSVDALGAFNEQLRHQGQAFALIVLAALDRSGATAAIELILAKTLDAGTSDYNSTLLAVRALGAGIATSETLRKRLVRTLVALLLLPPGARIGVMRCNDIFTTDDLPDPIALARRPAIRAAIVEQLHERWAVRDPRRRNLPPPLIISEREASLLDRLSIWSDIGIPVARPSTASRSQIHAQTRPARAAAPDPVLAAAHLTHALWRMKEDSTGFFASFAEFSRGDGSGLPPDVAARAYIEGLLRDTNPPPE